MASMWLSHHWVKKYVYIIKICVFTPSCTCIHNPILMNKQKTVKASRQCNSTFNPRHIYYLPSYHVVILEVSVFGSHNDLTSVCAEVSCVDWKPI